MQKKSGENLKKAWNEIGKNYAKIIVPNRPSIDDCRIYGKSIFEVLKNKKKLKIMIMGSTPELRRIMYSLEFLQDAEVYCVDMNSNMYAAMSNFIINGRHFKENLIQRSWIDTEFKDENFDLIVGDEVICNVPSDLHKNLFIEIKRILKKDGAWITRHNFFTKSDKKLSIRKILNDLGEGLSDGSLDFQYAMNLLNVKMLYHLGWADHTNNSLMNYWELSNKEYQASFKNHKLGKIIAELLAIDEENFVPLAKNYKWYILSKEESLKELGKFFEIENETYSNDYPTVKNSPIYILRKK